MSTSPDTEGTRRRAVAWAVAMTADTPLAPKRYERQLLERYQRGELTIDTVIARLDVSVYHVFYRSQAVFFPTQTQLDELLAWSRHYNALHRITGLLLYSDGRFAQVIEGAEMQVRLLFERIQQDSRHQHVFTISEGPGPHRWFADWQMAFGHLEAGALNQVLQVVERGVRPVFPVDDPHLQTLIEVFGLAE